MEELIKDYINEHSNAWSESTRKSELSRLSNLDLEFYLSPESLWNSIRDLGGYSRVTAWTRTISFFDYLIERGAVQGPNQFRIFRKKNARLFRNCYERKHPDCSYEAALRRIGTIEDRQIREACLALLKGALRVSELSTFDPATSSVVGKGNKRRRIYTEVSDGAKQASVQRIRSALLSRGLKPHDLRKLGATEFRKKGLRDEDLLQVMGWTSMETAKSYLKPLTEAEIKEKIAG